MSKRIAGNVGTSARNGRIKIGWRKRRMLDQMEKMEEALRMGKLAEDAKAKFMEFKERVFKVIPKRILRRHQSR